MSLRAQVRKKKIVDNAAGVSQVRAEIVVVDGNRNVVNKRSFRADLHLPAVTQEDVQARLNEAKERALSEAESKTNIDLDGLT